MFVDREQATTISDHPSVEAKPRELQGLNLSERYSSQFKNYRTIDSVYDDYKKSKECFLTFGQINALDDNNRKSLGIDILCTDHGLYVMASCRGMPPPLPLFHKDYDMHAFLALDNTSEEPRAVGIIITYMYRNNALVR